MLLRVKSRPKRFRTVPELNPGENFVIGADFTITTYFNEEHRIVVTIDATNAVSETNEGDNILSVNYVLQPGACP